MKFIFIAFSTFCLFQTICAQTVDTNRDPSHIDVYITPFYNSEGPTIDVGKFSRGLASTNEEQFIATICEMRKRWSELNFVEMYVATIRLFDWGYRKESIYWFYSAQYRGRLFRSLLDEKRMGSIGDPGFELLQANNAFHQLVGPYINSYAFGDTDYLGQVLERIRKETKQLPDIKGAHPKVSFKEKSEWTALNQEVGDGLGKLAETVKQQKDELKRKRIETGVEAQFSKLTSKKFPDRP